MHLEPAHPLMYSTSQTRSTSHKIGRLEGESVASSTDNRTLDLGSRKKVGHSVRGLGQGTLLSSVLATAKVVTRLNCEPSIGRVQWLLGIDENVVLDKQLRALACVDAVRDVLVVVVEEVAGAKAERGATRVQVLHVVVGVCDGKVTLVLCAIRVGVSDQGCLPVVVHEGVGDGDEVGGVGNVEKTIVVVLVMITICGEVEVVDPDVLGLHELLVCCSVKY